MYKDRIKINMYTVPQQHLIITTVQNRLNLELSWEKPYLEILRTGIMTCIRGFFGERYG